MFPSLFQYVLHIVQFEQDTISTATDLLDMFYMYNKK